MPAPTRPIRSRPARVFLAAAVTLSVLTTPSGRLHAQEVAGGWNAPETLALVERAVERRLLPLQDSLLFSYAARAEGHIHFLADRLDGSDPIPLRVDQVALDLYWMAPDLTRQEIRGMRAEELLPIKDFRYYLDRLTVIQNGFGDVIQVGQGMDVRSVPHPLARYVQHFYDYALGDSVTVRLPGAPDPVRVVEVKVRPRDPGLPGYVGSVFLDAATGAISKLEFTFTPSSYVDRRIDRVRITLEHGLWQGRWWLPFRQQVEVRREIPELDIRVQSVIQGVLTVEEYSFNEALPAAGFLGPGVVLPGADGEDPMHFRRELFAEMEAQGLQRPDLAALEAEARRMVRDRALSGLPSTRLHWDRASSLVRANRAEGVYAGAGLSRSVGPDARIAVLGGWASGPRRPVAVARVRFDRPAGPHLRVEGVAGGVRDVGQTPGLDPFLNTASTLFGRDYTDLYRVDGGSLGVEWWGERGAVLRMGVRSERHRAAGLAWVEGPVGGPGFFRPPPMVDEGLRTVLRLEVEGPWAPAGLPLGVRLTLEGGAFDGDGLVRALGGLSWSRRSPDGARGARVALEGGVQGGGGLPWQDRFLLGGMGTLPGHPFREWGGTRYALLSAEGERAVVPGWISARIVGAAGAVGGGYDPRFAGAPCPPEVLCLGIPTPQGARGSRGVRASIGAGLGLVRGVLRIDRMWGVGGGRGEWSVSVHPSFRPWL
jgi:hypothetical protein